MNHPRHWTIAALMVAGLATACGSNANPSNPVVDAGQTGTDVPVTTDHPATTSDTPRTDGATPTDRPVTPTDGTVTTVDPCTTAHDLSGMTAGSDGALHVMGDNSTAPAVSVGALPDTCTSGAAKGAVVVYQYTMHTSALLQVSTANAGTADGVDTIVAVLTTCSATATPLTCNDDADQNAPGPSTAITTANVAAGTHVFIAVGGYGMDATNASTGAFELTIREVTPVAVGGACTATSVCATGSGCHPNAAGATVCIMDGTAGGACNADGTCGAGLGCTGSGVCRTPLALNAVCAGTDACPAAAHCAAVDATLRRCLADGAAGAACRVTGTACDASLTCSAATPTAAAPGLCQTVVAVGAACDAAHGCPAASHCLRSATDASVSSCLADGAAGAACRTTGTFCDAGLTCSADDPTMAAGICRTSVMGTAACDPTGRLSTCATTNECAPSATFTAGTCAAPGTAAGVSCRATGTACDTGLTCSNAMPTADDPGLCQRAAAAGAACDYRFGATACATATLCAPNSVTGGACTATRAETEPNNTPAAAQAAVTASTVYTASLTPGSDVDCFNVTVPANASLFLLTSDNQGGCPTGADTIVTLYNAAGAELATNDDIDAANGDYCSLLDGTRGGAHHLAAGTYTACVSAYGTAAAALPAYDFTIGIIPAP